MGGGWGWKSGNNLTKDICSKNVSLEVIVSKRLSVYLNYNAWTVESNKEATVR